MQQATHQPEKPPGRARRLYALYALLLLLGIGMTLIFALRATRSFRHFQENRHRPPLEQVDSIAPWMTIPYAGAAYAVPPEFIFEQLGLPAAEYERKPLRLIDHEEFDGERGEAVRKVRAAVELYYAGSAVPTPIVPEPGSVPLPEEPQGSPRSERGAP